MAQSRRKKSDPNAWRTASIAPITVFQGPEDFIVGRVFDRFRTELKSADPNTEVVRLSAKDYQPGELLVQASPSLFGEAKLLYVDQLEKMSDAFLNDALSYLEEPSDDVTLLCWHAGGNRGKKLMDALKKAGTLIDCARITTDSQKSEVLQAEFRAARRKIESPALKALLDAVGTSPSELLAAANQLMSDTEGTITEETVDKYYGGRVHATAFKVADAALEGKMALALGLLRHAMGTGADPVAITGALGVKARQIATVIDARISQSQIPQALGVPPWQAQRVTATMRFWTGPGIAGAIEAIAQADAEVKGQARTPEYSVEKMVSFVARTAASRSR